MNLRSLSYRIKRKIFKEKKLNDHALTAIKIINAGMLHEGNNFLLDHAIKNAPTTGAFLEIGSFCGQSASIICYLMRKHGKTNLFFSCDKWDFEEKEFSNYAYLLPIPYDQYRQFVKESFIRNLNFLGGAEKPFAMEMFSDDFFEIWQSNSSKSDVFNRTCKLGGNLSFAFIDGNHTYDYVKRDFENTDKYLLKGGFILFDDSADHWDFGSSNFMDEMKKNKNYALVFKNPNYLFKKVI
ncbi:hypothetical protein BH11BAC2_BH11BAC2_11080 [soil metagenome]